MNAKMLENQVAFVTGGGKGIGRAIAELYAAEGASIVVVDYDRTATEDAVATIERMGGKALGISMDVTSSQNFEAAFAQAIETFGQIDILVNSAGIATSVTVENTSDEQWDRVMDLNVNATFYCCREAVKHMLLRGTGSIINISSCAGLKPLSGCPYSTSKGAVITLTRNMAFRLADTDIRCNCICPGIVATSMQATVKAQNKSNADQVNMHAFGDRYVRRELPTLQPEGQANVALFLASDLAKDITGAAIPVDRGAYMPC